MKENKSITCPQCQSDNITPYKNILLGFILLFLMWPLGLLYLILTPKYRCQDCKKLFPKMFEGTKIGKIGTIFLVLVILFLLYGLINFLIVMMG